MQFLIIYGTLALIAICAQFIPLQAALRRLGYRGKNDTAQTTDSRYWYWQSGEVIIGLPWCPRMQEFMAKEKELCATALITIASLAFHASVCILNGIVFAALGHFALTVLGAAVFTSDMMALVWFFLRPKDCMWVGCILLFDILAWPLGLAVISLQTNSFLNVLIHGVLGLFLMVFLDTGRWCRSLYILAMFGCLITVHCLVGASIEDKINWLLNVFLPCTLFVALACGYSALKQFQMQQVSQRSQEEIDRLKSGSVILRTRAGFVATLAHEVRTPLNAMLQSITLLRDSNLTEEQTMLTECLLECGEQIHDNVTSVLEFSRLQNQKVVLNCTPFSLMGLCNSCINMIRHAAERKHIELRQRFNLGYEGDYLVGDCARLKQVLLNLLSNAVKFVSEGYVELTTTTHFVLNDEDTIHVRFEIIDTGIGISPTNQQKLFNPYQQATPTTWEQYSGTGLGLYIAKELVTMMGGSIGIVSERTAPGRGSCFFVDLMLPAITMTGNLSQMVSCSNTEQEVRIDIACPKRHECLVPPSMTCPVSLNFVAFGNGLPSASSAPVIPESNTRILDSNDCWRPSKGTPNSQRSSNRRRRLASYASPDRRALLQPATSCSSIETCEQPALALSFHSQWQDSIGSWHPPVPTVSITSEVPDVIERPDPDDLFTEDEVLLAEDNEINLKLTGKILQTLQFKKVHLVTNGKDAVDTWVANPNIHFIILDNQMPILGGLEAAKLIKEHSKQLAGERPAPYLISLSGASDIDFSRTGFFNASLLKPATRRELSEILREAKGDMDH